jgi:CxxC motif-containing protein (DUF1111 family)
MNRWPSSEYTGKAAQVVPACLKFGFSPNVLLLLVSFCFGSFRYSSAVESTEEFSGGAATVFDDSRNAFTFPAPNLTPAHRTQFFVGNSFFNQNWVAAPATPATRDGVGPLFVTRSCSACHFKDGRSAPPASGAAVETMVVRLAMPGSGGHDGLVPDPVYGAQLQTSAIPRVRAEGSVIVKYELIEGEFSDGEKFVLRRPVFSLANLGYGPLADNIAISPLVSPAVIGLGLLEAVPEDALRRFADEKDSNGDGISGRLNVVWEASSQRFVPGRFGWKAEQPSVRQQAAAAFNGDMGLTTTVFPNPNQTAAQSECDTFPSGGDPEVTDQIFEAVVNYSRTLAVPARRDWNNPLVRRGEKLFHQMNCSACHVPELKTGDVPDMPELAHQTIRPYTDLLLHDLGEGLSDQRKVFEAGGRERRTAPLWGIGLVKTVNRHTYFLHDGRARDLSEAILWHGGEAERSKVEFRNLNRNDREAVVRFLESL